MDILLEIFPLISLILFPNYHYCTIVTLKIIVKGPTEKIGEPICIVFNQFYLISKNLEPVKLCEPTRKIPYELESETDQTFSGSALLFTYNSDGKNPKVPDVKNFESVDLINLSSVNYILIGVLFEIPSLRLVINSVYQLSDKDKKLDNEIGTVPWKIGMTWRIFLGNYYNYEMIMNSNKFHLCQFNSNLNQCGAIVINSCKNKFYDERNLYINKYHFHTNFITNFCLAIAKDYSHGNYSFFCFNDKLSAVTRIDESLISFVPISGTLLSYYMMFSVKFPFGNQTQFHLSTFYRQSFSICSLTFITLLPDKTRLIMVMMNEMVIQNELPNLLKFPIFINDRILKRIRTPIPKHMRIPWNSMFDISAVDVMHSKSETKKLLKTFISSLIIAIVGIFIGCTTGMFVSQKRLFRKIDPDDDD
ncbi:hypothetical protein SNEBB_006769 [Seison nebaliae]|nr:hypothetical protein SNEBB_006769 [Seison nebaliae]